MRARVYAAFWAVLIIGFLLAGCGLTPPPQSTSTSVNTPTPVPSPSGGGSSGGSTTFDISVSSTQHYNSGVWYVTKSTTGKTRSIVFTIGTSGAQSPVTLSYSATSLVGKGTVAWTDNGDGTATLQFTPLSTVDETTETDRSIYIGATDANSRVSAKEIKLHIMGPDRKADSDTYRLNTFQASNGADTSQSGYTSYAGDAGSSSMYVTSPYLFSLGNKALSLAGTISDYLFDPHGIGGLGDYFGSLMFWLNYPSTDLGTLGGEQTVLSGKSRIAAAWTSPGVAGFASRTRARVLQFNNKLWLIAGYKTVAGANSNDVWSSVDGITWTQVRADGAAGGFTPRMGFGVAVHNGYMWVVGGQDSTGAVNDAWYSSDGITWTLARANGAANGFAPRTAFPMVSFQGYLWLVHGYYGLDGTVYRSSDGITWTAYSTTGAPGRRDHNLVVFNNKLFEFGGLDDPTSTLRNDVWWSSDGFTWAKATDNPGWSPRMGAATVVFDGRLWIIGGWAGTAYLKDVWSTSDGVHWQQEASDPGFAPRGYVDATVFKNRIYEIGSTTTSDIWMSSARTLGSTWTKAATTSWPARARSTTIKFNNKLWMLAGYGATALNDIWSSSDGVTWNFEGTAPYSKRLWAGTTVYNGKLWLVGGTNTSWEPLSDVWSSTDGVNWELVTAAPAFGSRTLSALLSFNNKMWLIGGTDWSAWRNTVFSSTDGVTWTLQSAAAAFPALGYGPTGAVFNNRMWIWGGYDGVPYTGKVTCNTSSNELVGTGTSFLSQFKVGDSIEYGGNSRNYVMEISSDNSIKLTANCTCNYTLVENAGVLRNHRELWSSTDGISWTRSADFPFWPRTFSATTVHDGRLWIAGGDGLGPDGGPRNDVWYTYDGESWLNAAVEGGFSVASSYSFGLHSFLNRLWVVGVGANSQEVWYSEETTEPIHISLNEQGILNASVNMKTSGTTTRYNLTTSNPISTGSPNWNHIALTWDASKSIKLFLNGASEASTAIMEEQMNTVDQIEVGRGVPMKMDELMIKYVNEPDANIINHDKSYFKSCVNGVCP